jgi:hypothetical protein
MTLSSRLGLAGVGIFTMVAAITASAGSTGCSSSSSGSGGGSSSGGGSGGDTCSGSSNCTLPPAAPSGGSPAAGSHNYAIRKLYLGGNDRTGLASSSAWKSYGYNLDNLITAQSSTDVCTLQPGAAKSTQVDGNGGIDNSFGENIWPIVQTTAGTDAEQTINTSIEAGHFTVMSYVTGFDDTASSTASATGLTGILLAGGNYGTVNDGGTPTWDTTTHWPILPSLITGCTETGGCAAGTDPVANATIKFPSAYQANGTFVNGSPAQLALTLSIQGQSLTINVDSAIITFQPATGGVTNGTIAGTIVADDLVTQLQGVAGSISSSLCSGSAFNSIAQQIKQASDIVIDTGSGAVSNAAGATCNGISIGIGFDGTEIAAPTAADLLGAQAAPPNPCADAGAGD